jgi:hypothetical protein
MLGDRARRIKVGMMMELAKEGKTLKDLEQQLSSGAITKTALGITDFSNFIQGSKSVANLMGLSAALVGGSVGALGYGAYRANEDSNDKAIKKMREIRQYQNAQRVLKENLENPITL